MENVTSYFDWQQGFKKSSKSRKKLSNYKKNRNSIGLSEDFFLDFVSKWKKKNL